MNKCIKLGSANKEHRGRFRTRYSMTPPSGHSRWEKTHQESGELADNELMDPSFRLAVNRRQQITAECRRDRGVVLLVFAAMVFGVVAICGLAIDLGQMYVAKGELQNYTDAAAIASALKLDGTTTGIAQATSEALNNVNTWKFGTGSASNVTVEFSTAVDGAYIANPLTGVGYRFVRVTAQEPVAMVLLATVPGAGSSSNVAASSTAGQMLLSGIGDGVLPFSPDAHDINDPNFGYLLGQPYTLRWAKAVGNPPAGSYLTSVNGQKLIGCQGDMTSVPAFQPGETSASQRGYIDLGNLDPIGAGGGAALIRDAVLGRVSFNLQIVPFQYVVNPEPGQKQTITSAMVERVLQDTDPTTATYYTSPQTATNTPSADVMNETMRTAYNTVTLPRPPNGNARRIASVPINNPLTGLVIGFAGIFLPPVPCAEVQVGNKTYEPCCGEYIGAVTSSGTPAAGPGGGAYRIVLFR